MAAGAQHILADAVIALSAVDLASQVVISLTEHKIKQRSDLYPVGRARLEVSIRGASTPATVHGPHMLSLAGHLQMQNLSLPSHVGLYPCHMRH